MSEGLFSLSLSVALGPRGGSLPTELLHNSIPHQLLEIAMIVFAPLPTQGTIHLTELLDVVLVCTQ